MHVHFPNKNLWHEAQLISNTCFFILSLSLSLFLFAPSEDGEKKKFISKTFAINDNVATIVK